jgi:cytochrome c oxidase subunit 2
LPDPATKQAERIDFVYWFATVISLVIFAVVCAIMIYAMINFRAKPGDWSDGPPVHGNTTIEIIWTIIPAILVTAISIVSAIVLAQNSHAGTDPLIVKVQAQQFAWEFVYPNGKSYPILRLPIDRGVKLEITSKDVIHSFWVPEFGQKQDAVPGQVNNLVITPNRLGHFPVICTELCGLGHAVMRSHVTVMSPADFATWQKSGGAAAAGPPGLAVFQQSGCGGCHTLKSAGATGKVGPDLDNLAQYAAQAKRGTLEAFIKESIVNPAAYLQPGFPDAMPHIYASQLSTEQLNQLVQYLAGANK